MKTLEPLKAGSVRTVCSAAVANALIDGANKISNMRGDGDGIRVTHSDSNIVIDLGCPVPRKFTFSQSVIYWRTGGSPTSLHCPPAAPGIATPLTYTDTNTIGAEYYWQLYDYFPDQLFWDGACGIILRVPGVITAFPQSRVTSPPGAVNKWADHPDFTPLTIGPFTKRMVIFSATNLYADDRLYYRIDTGAEVLLGQGGEPSGLMLKNSPLAVLEIGQTMRFRVLETGGAYCWGLGYIGAKSPACVPKAWRDTLGI